MTVSIRFRPQMTAGTIDQRACYDYGPSIVAGRIWWTAGLGTDTIVSAPLAGRPGPNGVPWHLPGKLVADPCAIGLGHATLVLHTVGDPDGKRNGIGWFLSSDPTKPPRRSGTLIAQTGNGTYGTGQPGMAVAADGMGLLVCRVDGAEGTNTLAAWWVDTDSVLLGADLTLGEPVTFTEPEDGASPEPFWCADGRLGVFVTGGGWMGVRTYCLNNNTFTRERHLEVASPVAAGGEFWAQSPMAVAGAVDGLGVERDARNRPVANAEHVHLWQAVGDPAHPGTWTLRRLTYRMPGGLL